MLSWQLPFFGHVLCFRIDFGPAFTNFTKVVQLLVLPPGYLFLSLLPFLEPRIPYWSILIFVILGKHISTSIIQSIHADGCIQYTGHFEAVNTFVSGMKCLYVILVEQIQYNCTFSCRLDDTLEKVFPVVSFKLMLLFWWQRSIAFSSLCYKCHAL